MTYFSAPYSPIISSPMDLWIPLEPQNDPCSLSYIRSSTVPASERGTFAEVGHRIRSTKHERLRRSTRKIVRAMKRGVKQIFCLRSSRSSIKAPRSSFVMPFEYAALNRNNSRSSMRSRRSLISHEFPKMTSQSLPNLAIGSKRSSDQPTIMVHSPSQRQRYTIHEYTGNASNSNMPLAERKSVLLAHPAVTGIIQRPATPTTIATTHFPEDDSDTEWSTIDSDEESEDVDLSSRPVTSGSSLMSSEFAGQVDPKQLFKVSFMNGHLEGSKADFEKLKDALDGLKLSGKDAFASMRPLSGKRTWQLPPRSKSPSLSFDGPADAQAGAAVEQNRKSALATLEGLYPVMVQADAVITRKRGSLKGLPVEEQTPVRQRPHTVAGLLPYTAYTPDLDPFGNVRHPPKQVKSTEELDETGVDRPSTPSNFADCDTHKEHYSRVESGIFDTRVLPNARPHNLEPPAHFSAVSAVAGALSAFIASSTLHSHATGPSTKTTMVAERRIKRKAVPARPVSDKNKPLPDVPGIAGQKRDTNVQVPNAIKMNDNGYPIIVRRSVQVSTEQVAVKKHSEKTQRKQTKPDVDTAKLRRQQRQLENALQCVML